MTAVDVKETHPLKVPDEDMLTEDGEHYDEVEKHWWVLPRKEIFISVFFGLLAFLELVLASVANHPFGIAMAILVIPVISLSCLRRKFFFYNSISRMATFLRVFWLIYVMILVCIRFASLRSYHKYDVFPERWYIPNLSRFLRVLVTFLCQDVLVLQRRVIAQKSSQFLTCLTLKSMSENKWLSGWPSSHGCVFELLLLLTFTLQECRHSLASQTI
jgi:hypothetical protein